MLGKDYTYTDEAKRTRSYFSSLHLIRRGVLSKKHGLIARGLETLWKQCRQYGIPFSDFLTFNGIFQSSKWFWIDGMETGFVHDVIYNVEEPLPGWNQFLPTGWTLKDAQNPGEMLLDIFGELLFEGFCDFVNADSEYTDEMKEVERTIKTLKTIKNYRALRELDIKALEEKATSGDKLQIPTAKNKLKPIFTDDTHTPPISAAALADKLCVSPSIISNKKRPLGAYFKKYCDDQGTKTPRLEYDTLWYPAKESVRRSTRPGAEDLVFNDIAALITLWM